MKIPQQKSMANLQVQLNTAIHFVDCFASIVVVSSSMVLQKIILLRCIVYLVCMGAQQTPVT